VTRPVAVALLLALVAGASPARADEPSPGATDHASPWPMAGALTAVGTLAIGGALMAQDQHPDLQKAGATIAALGFATAPWVAHARSGHCNRALVFGLTTVATSLGMVITMNVTDPYNPATPNADRIPYGIALTAAFFAAAAGVVDGFLVAPGPDGKP
jgi:hypothetical protein